MRVQISKSLILLGQCQRGFQIAKILMQENDLLIFEITRTTAYVNRE